MIGAPAAGKAQIEIAERAGERDRADIALTRGRRRAFQRRKAARDLARVMIEPFGDILAGFTIAGLVDLQQRRVHDAVGERLQRQGLEARPGRGRNDPVAARQPIEIFDDHGAIVERGAVLEDQRRDLAERILAAQRIAGIVGVGGGDVDSFAETENRRRDPDLAAEGRCGRRAQDEHGRSS